jgi:hypothetical protein
MGVARKALASSQCVIVDRTNVDLPQARARTAAAARTHTRSQRRATRYRAPRHVARQSSERASERGWVLWQRKAWVDFANQLGHAVAKHVLCIDPGLSECQRRVRARRNHIGVTTS